jgi:hypothetical protein
MPKNSLGSFRKEASLVAKQREKRRGVRLNSRVPVLIEWTDASGNKVRAQADTRIVNPYGCMVVLRVELNLDQRVQLTNLATKHSNPAVVVWKGNPRQEGFEVGVELVSPQMDFWGLQL